MILKNIIRNTIRILLWTAAAAVLFFITITSYLLLMSRSTRSYLPADSVLTIKGDALKYTRISGWNRLYPGFSTEYPDTAALVRTFNFIRKKLPGLFRRMSPATASPFTIAVSGGKKSLLVIDLGWKSTLFSASSFIVRSAFSPEHHIRFSSREVNCAGSNRTLYRIRFRERGPVLHLTLSRNLLFLSLSETEIIRAFTAARSKRSLAKDRGYVKALGRTGSSSHCSLFLRKTRQRWPDNSNFIPFPGKRWTAITSDPRGGIRGHVTFGRKIAEKHPVLFRLLHSNSFYPQTVSVKTTGNWSREYLFFDDLSEILKMRNLGTLPPRICQYSSNEAGLIRNAAGWRIYLKLLSRRDGNKISRWMEAGIKKSGTGYLYRKKLSPLTALFQMPPPRHIRTRGATLLCSKRNRVPGGKKDPALYRKLLRLGFLPANYLSLKKTGNFIVCRSFRFADGAVRFRKASWTNRTAR